MADNKLFYGDNLDVLRRYVRDESVGPHLSRSAIQQPLGLQRPLRREGRHPFLCADHGLRGHVGVEPRRRARLSGSGRARGMGLERHAGVSHVPRQ